MESTLDTSILWKFDTDTVSVWHHDTSISIPFDPPLLVTTTMFREIQPAVFYLTKAVDSSPASELSGPPTIFPGSVGHCLEAVILGSTLLPV